MIERWKKFCERVEKVYMAWESSKQEKDLKRTEKISEEVENSKNFLENFKENMILEIKYFQERNVRKKIQFIKDIKDFLEEIFRNV